MSACLQPCTAAHRPPLPISAEQGKATIGRPLETLPLARRCDLGGFRAETLPTQPLRKPSPPLGQPAAPEPLGFLRFFARLSRNASSCRHPISASEGQCPTELLAPACGDSQEGRAVLRSAPFRGRVQHLFRSVSAALLSTCGHRAFEFGWSDGPRRGDGTASPPHASRRGSTAEPKFHFQRRARRDGQTAIQRSQLMQLRRTQ